MNVRAEWLTVLVSLAALAGVARSFEPDAETSHARGVAAHLERDLGTAAAYYDGALLIEPPAPPSPVQLDAVRRFAPRVFTTASEPFALRDAAAIIHPTSRTIAYHLFWEDDIDFPDDNDPCDHEVVWIRHSPDAQRLERLWTYFHGRLLEDRAPTAMRPRINVQWGKHGSLPEAWQRLEVVPEISEVVDGIPQSMQPITLVAYLDGAYRKLSTSGRRLADHPIAARLGWPSRFRGTREDFTRFSREVDLLTTLAPQSVLVSRFNSGTLNRFVVPYNFRPKIEWPPGDR
jgi:hypothetical protein